MAAISGSMHRLAIVSVPRHDAADAVVTCPWIISQWRGRRPWDTAAAAGHNNRTELRGNSRPIDGLII